MSNSIGNIVYNIKAPSRRISFASMPCMLSRRTTMRRWRTSKKERRNQTEQIVGTMEVGLDGRRWRWIGTTYNVILAKNKSGNRSTSEVLVVHLIPGRNVRQKNELIGFVDGATGKYQFGNPEFIQDDSELISIRMKD